MPSPADETQATMRAWVDGRRLRARGSSDGRGSALEALFSYGFRPFFLLGAAWAPLALATMLAAFAGVAWNPAALPLLRWHGHEMLFGFVAAAIAGFLLTAVPTWTGTQAIAGRRLAALAALWVAGRIVASPLTGLHATPAIVVELLFFPALMLALAGPLIGTRNVRNYPFLVMLGLLFVADLLFHALAISWLAPLPFDPLRFAANLVLAMIVVVGGRIVPAFTRNALVRAGKTVTMGTEPMLERASIAAVVLVIVVDLVRPVSVVAGVAAAVAAVLLGARLARWHGHRAIGMPIVFILHVGYGWLVIALALKAMWLLAAAPWAANWLHAQTAGAFGTMILAVTTRVALGHTGRPLEVHSAIVVAYALVVAGGLLRVFGPGLLPLSAVHVLGCAMLLWSSAFVIFLVIYAPILAGPRVDAPA